MEPARPAPLICPPCGIRFSSASTLEAHRTFYCAHRPRLEEEAANEEDEEKSNKFEVRKAYACPHCSYSADKKVSLNRHMRMHAASPAPPTIPTAPTTATTPATGAATASNGSLNEEAERYCRNCDIRFSSLKTYRAHKTHYCSTRHVVKDAQPAATVPSSSVKASPPTSASPGESPPPQPCLALPTNPILIVPYSLFRGASVLAAPTLPAPDTACFLLPNGKCFPPFPLPFARAVSNPFFIRRSSPTDDERSRSHGSERRGRAAAGSSSREQTNYARVRRRVVHVAVGVRATGLEREEITGSSGREREQSVAGTLLSASATRQPKIERKRKS